VAVQEWWHENSIKYTLPTGNTLNNEQKWFRFWDTGYFSGNEMQPAGSRVELIIKWLLFFIMYVSVNWWMSHLTNGTHWIKWNCIFVEAPKLCWHSSVPSRVVFDEDFCVVGTLPVWLVIILIIMTMFCTFLLCSFLGIWWHRR